MGPKQLYLHTSNRIESLAARLVEVAARNPSPSALSRETVMTLNPGMARWLSFEIARQSGVAFGWEFPLPAKLFNRVLAGFAPDFELRGAFPENLARWHLADLLAKLEDQPRFSLVRHYCQSGSPQRRFAFASRLARLFDEYLVYRPDTITAWEDDPSSNYDWQPEIWRRLLRQLSPSQRQPRHIARLWSELRYTDPASLQPRLDAWPQRLFLFGVSALAPLHLDLLDTLAHFRPVHIFLLQPSDLYWADLKSSKDIQKTATRAARRQASQVVKPEDWLFETGNPLLPAFGKQSQMFLDLVIDKDPQQDDSSFDPPDEDTQLHALQADLFTLACRDFAETGESLPPYDGTLQIHSCANRRREVETLWDFLIARFESDPTLAPSQILVMAPDIQKYRSHIEAVFKSKRGTHLEIPYTVADTSAASTGGPLGGLAALFRSANTRASAAEVLALLETPLLREAFRFSDLDLERIEFWIRELGIAWGWGADHRRSRDAFPTDRNTWSELRSRLSAGLAFSSDAPLPSGFSAYPEIEADLCDTAGRLLECLALLSSLREGYAQTHRLDLWQHRLLAWLGQVSTEREDWQTDYLRASDLIVEAVPDLPSLDATGMEVFAAVADALDAQSGSGGYLSGGVTFCSLKPMRAIPADTICLVGMNRLDFPRRATRLSFDLLARNPRPGDRSAREEDRQFFLETLLSVRSHLFISYEGSAGTSDATKEPSTVVEELQNYLRRALPPEDYQAILHTQRRLSFDPAYFGDGPLFTYDPERAELRRRFDLASHERPQKTDTPESPPNSEPQSLDLESFIAFFRDPAKAFATGPAKLRLLTDDDPLPEIDTLFPDGLDRFQFRQTIADTLAQGEPLDSLSRAAIAQRKMLPPGYSESTTFASEIESAVAIAACLGPTTPSAHLVSISLDSLQINAAIQLRQPSSRQLLLAAGELNAPRLIDAWIRHLVALCAVPEFCGQTVVATLQPKQEHALFASVENARALLHQLALLYCLGQTSPLPLLPKLSRKCYLFWAKSKLEDPDSRAEAALADARKTLDRGQEDNDFIKTFEWSPYDQACFGDDFLPDNAFLERAIDFWQPLEAALTSLKTASLPNPL